MKKLLIYTVAYGEAYFNEALINAHSLRTIGKYSGDIVIFTNKIYNADPYNSNIIIIVSNKLTSIQVAAAFRLRIFQEFPYWNYYDTFMYLDTDIVTVNTIDLDYIYSICDLEKVNVYGYSNRDQNAIGQAGSVTNDPKILKHKSICSGILIFTKELKETINEVYRYWSQQKDTSVGWEQPAICYVLIKNNKVCVNLDSIIFEERIKYPCHLKSIIKAENGNINIMFHHFNGLNIKVNDNERPERMRQRLKEYSESMKSH